MQWARHIATQTSYDLAHERSSFGGPQRQRPGRLALAELTRCSERCREMSPEMLLVVAVAAFTVPASWGPSGVKPRYSMGGHK